MHVPEEFQDRLTRAFDGRLRIRWSASDHVYHIEQKVARALINFPAALTDDEAIRLRDGYHFLMAITTGDRLPCPKCRTTLPVPLRVSTMVSCPTCRAKGLEHRVPAAFFPLDDTLIDHLHSIDPMRGMSPALRAKVDAHNAKVMQAQQQQALDQLTGAAADDFTRIAGIPSVGYTGRETYL